MQIVLTEPSGTPLVIDHSVILLIRKDPKGKIETHMVTSVTGPNGLQAFTVNESPLEIGLMVNRARHLSDTHALDPTALGFKMD